MGAYGKEAGVKMVHDVTVFKIIVSKPGVTFLLHFESIISLLIKKFVDSEKIVTLEVHKCFT